MRLLPRHKFSQSILIAAVACATTFSAMAGTVVRMVTPLGNIDLELYDQARPITVQNFLGYMNDGSYLNTFSHRLVEGFVFQGGGFRIDNNSINSVPTKGAIPSEFNGDAAFTNAKGTIAMAQVGTDKNSATSQWFINMVDNNNGTAPANLDTLNGGFTVFGRVISGLSVVDMYNTQFVNSLTGGWGIYDASSALGSSAFGELPLLANTLNVQNFIYTKMFVLPATITLTGKRVQRVKRKVTVVNGTASTGVEAIECKLGGNGPISSIASSSPWSIKVSSLKHGTNKFYFRAVIADGTRTAFQVVRIIRR
jgi:cyclophilin family peptidyl-prolyl cis-trans isomerase